MKKIKLILLFGIMCMHTAPLLYAKEKLTLQRYLTLARHHSEYFKAIKSKASVAESRLRYTNDGKELTFKVNPYASRTEKPDLDYYESYITTERNKTIGVQMGVQKNIWSTGTSIELGVSTSRSQSSITDRFLERKISEKNYTTKYSLTMVQPLLQNWKGTLFRLESDLAAYHYRIEKLQIEEDEEQYLKRAVQAYIQWAAYRKMRASAKNRIAYLQRLRTNAQRMSRKNIIARSDLLQTREELETARAAHKEIEQTLATIESQLVCFSHVDSFKNKEPDFDLNTIQKLPERDFHVTSRVLKILDYSKKKAARALGAYQNMEQPRLDLQLSASVKDSDKEFDETLNASEEELYAGIVFTYPLGTNKASGHCKEMSALLRQIAQEKNLAERDISTSLENRQQEYMATKAIIRIYSRKLAAARSRSRLERSNLKKGKTSIFMYLNACSEVESGRMMLWETKARLHLLYLSYLDECDMLRDAVYREDI